MLEQFQVARRRATPLIHIKTMDPEATQLAIAEAYKPEPTDKGDDPRTSEQPIVTWDSVQGMRGLNARGIASARASCRGDEKPEDLTSPVEALRAAARLADRTIFFVHNPQMFLSRQDDAAALMVQAIKNLRDPFKKKMRQLVMLGPWCFLPAEINQDVMVIDEPLPADSDLERIVLTQHKAAGLVEPDKKIVVKAVDALRGLATFPAEQVTAMSLVSKARGLDMEMLWERKRQTIEQTPGLSIWRGAESFDDIKGYDNAANFLKRFFDGKRPPKGVMFMDEIEKHIAGSTGGDLSGVKQDMLGALLIWMQDRRARGLLFMGVAGSGKSALAKAAGNYGQVPTISFDLAGMQESLVGKSGQNIRNGLKVVDAVTSGEVLVIATCNSMAALPPELRRRFKRGTFFFDLPNRSGREAIWNLYMKKFDLKKQKLPDDKDWTGAEIEGCCECADDFNCSLIDAANFVVPVAKSAPEMLKYLREMANDTFISASDGGIYRYEDAPDRGEREYNLN